MKKLFDDIAPRFKERNGGYTRIVKIGIRHGDAAPVSILELVSRTPDSLFCETRRDRLRIGPRVHHNHTHVASSLRENGGDGVTGSHGATKKRRAHLSVFLRCPVSPCGPVSSVASVAYITPHGH